MMCLVLLGGVWKPIVRWRTHMFTIFTPFFTLGPASTTLYSGIYTADTHCLRAPYPLQPLQLYSVSTVYSLYTTPLRCQRSLGGHNDDFTCSDLKCTNSHFLDSYHVRGWLRLRRARATHLNITGVCAAMGFPLYPSDTYL